MAYTTANAPFCMTQGPIAVASSTAMLNFGLRQWGYISSDALSTVLVSSYFSNGYTLGMRKYDIVWQVDTGSTLTSLLTVSAVTSAGNDPRGVTVQSQLTS